jgi:hypothetical protein
LGLCGGIAGAAYIRSGYVKLLGAIFYGAVFCRRLRDAALCLLLLPLFFMNASKAKGKGLHEGLAAKTVT